MHAATSPAAARIGSGRLLETIASATFVHRLCDGGPTHMDLGWPPILALPITFRQAAEVAEARRRWTGWSATSTSPRGRRFLIAALGWVDLLPMRCSSERYGRCLWNQRPVPTALPVTYSATRCYAQW